MPKQKTETAPSGGLKKSLRLIYVYAIAAGAIFTFIGTPFFMNTAVPALF